MIRKAGRAILGLLGIGFGCAAWIYLTLPDVRGLVKENPESTAFMRIRAREAHGRGEPFTKTQQWVGYGRISPNLTRAVLVTEDSKFWQHDGLDYEQLKESMEVNLERLEFARGGSTITQQLAKNLYLTPDKTPIRKLRELLIARRLEAELSKQRILEIYLNVIEWGDGVFGAEAAARRYFRKPAAELGPQEAALLAAAIANPHIMSPANPSGRLRRRQQMVLRRMGGVPVPPMLASTPGGQPPAEPATAIPPVADLPAQAPPAALPGQIVPPPAPPPGGRGPGSDL